MQGTRETENLLWKQTVGLNVTKAQDVILLSQKHPFHITASVKNNTEVKIKMPQKVQE